MDKDLEKAKALVQADMKKRGEDMNAELQELLKKYNCTLQNGEKGIYIQQNL